MKNNISLTRLWIRSYHLRSTKITSLDVSKNTALTDLICSDTEITSLDVSNNTALTDLSCGGTQIPFVDISNCTNLTNFSASGNKFYVSKNRTSIDASSDDDFTSIGFNFRNVYDVVGADYSRESGIFDNFTSDTVTYTYDCDGKRGHDVTFTMVCTDDESLLNAAAQLTLRRDNGTPPDGELPELPKTDAALPPDNKELFALAICLGIKTFKHKKFKINRRTL